MSPAPSMAIAPVLPFFALPGVTPVIASTVGGTATVVENPCGVVTMMVPGPSGANTLSCVSEISLAESVLGLGAPDAVQSTVVPSRNPRPSI